MDTIGVDLHKRESQLCIREDDGTLIERRIVTGRASFAAVLGTRARARILLEALTQERAPLVALLPALNEQIAQATGRLTTLAKADPAVPRLRTVPGVGPVTAVAFVAALDDVTRFGSAHQVQAYLGLVPSEHS